MKQSPHSFSQWCVLIGLATSFASAADSVPAPTKPAEAEQTPPAVTRGPRCVTLSEPENSAQAKLIHKINVQNAERQAQREADLAAISADRTRLDSGDFSPIANAVMASDVKRLWLFFDLARMDELGANDVFSMHAPADGSGVSARKSFNRHVFDQVRQALASVPGHAVLLGDKVDRLSNDPTGGGQRSGALRSLGELGSMEAIQQIGRFMADPRNPAAATREHGPLLPPGRMGHGNDFLACKALQLALGEKSPLRDDTGRAKDERNVEGDDLEFLLAWWRSDAARPYREWTHANGTPLLNPPAAAATAK